MIAGGRVRFLAFRSAAVSQTSRSVCVSRLALTITKCSWSEKTAEPGRGDTAALHTGKRLERPPS